MVHHDLTEITGSFGRWQIILFAIYVYTGLFGTWQNFSITFLAPNTEFQCINSTEQCSFVEGNSSVPCTEWQYNTSYNSENIISKWDLVCEREWLISLAKSMYMIGFLVSVFVFGQISDWIGRFPVTVVTYLICLTTLFLSPFSSSYTMFVVLRFFQALGRAGLTTTMYVLLMEIVGKKHCAKVGICSQIGFGIGFTTLGIVAYIFNDWFSLQMAFLAPYLLLALTFFWIPESPRWLLLQGKTKKLHTLLKKATSLNGKELNICDHDFKKYKDHSARSATVFDLFKTLRLRIWTCCMIYIWTVIAFIYYALSFNTNDLAGNPYINFIIMGSVEFPCYGLTYWSVGYFGRRPTLVTCMATSGVICALIPLAPTSMKWISTSLAMAGKFCITSAFRLVYLYTIEIFPTVVRNVAVGSCSMCARVGSITAPFVRELGKATYHWVPNVVYGLLAISSAFLALLLPETKERSIPDTIDESENFLSRTEKINVDVIHLQENLIKT